jgi:hypothetical protein
MEDYYVVYEKRSWCEGPWGDMEPYWTRLINVQSTVQASQDFIDKYKDEQCYRKMIGPLKEC